MEEIYDSVAWLTWGGAAKLGQAEAQPFRALPNTHHVVNTPIEFGMAMPRQWQRQWGWFTWKVHLMNLTWLFSNFYFIPRTGAMSYSTPLIHTSLSISTTPHCLFFMSLQSKLGLNVIPPSFLRPVANSSSSIYMIVSSALSSHPASQHNNYSHLYHSIIQLPMLTQTGEKLNLILVVPLRELWH